MEREQAYDVLGIDESVSVQEIEERFRELANEKHPDKGGSVGEIMELIEARNKVLDETASNMLVPYQPSKALAPRDPEHEQKKEQSQKTVNRVIRKQTSKYKRYKQVSKLLGGIIGFLTFINLVFRVFGVMSDRRFNPIYLFLFIFREPQLTEILLFSLIVIGIFYWYLTTKVRNIELIITEVEEALDQKSNVVSVLSELDINLQQEQISAEEMEDTMEEWIDESDENSPIRKIFSIMSINLNLRNIARQIGSGDFNRIFIQKSIENGILEEEVNAGETTGFEVTYKIKI